MDDAARPPASRRKTLTVAAATFMLLLDGTVLNTSLPAIAASLGVKPLQLSAVVTVYLLAGAAVLPMANWLADRLGLRRLFVIAIATFTGASILCALAGNATELVLARALQGLGGGLMLPTGRTLALRGARQDEVIGITALLVWPALFAPVLGPPLGGLLTTYASWHWNFWINVPIGALAVVLILRWVPEDGPRGVRPLDVAGALGAGLGLVLLLGGLEWTAQTAADAARRWGALLTAAAGAGLLAWTARHLRRSPNPVMSLEPFDQRTFRIATVSGGILATMALQSTPFLLPLAFQLALGRSAVEAGALLLPYFLGNLAMKTVTTPILNRFGFRRVMVVAALGNALAIACFAFVDPGTPLAATIVLLVVAGCVRSMLFTAVQTLAFADIAPASRGAASALSTVSMQTSVAIGVAVAALAVAIGQAAAGRAHPALADFAVAFVMLAVFCTVAALAFARLPADAGASMLRKDETPA